jgi:hypothetical protein
MLGADDMDEEVLAVVRVALAEVAPSPAAPPSPSPPESRSEPS